MSTPRQILATQFRADHAHKVYAFPYLPSEVRAPIIAVWRTDLSPHPQSPNALRHSLIIQAYGGASLEERAEAELDDLLDDVMFSLQRIQNLAIDSAERTVFGDETRGTFQGWVIKCHADSANVYKQTILTEGA